MNSIKRFLLKFGEFMSARPAPTGGGQLIASMGSGRGGATPKDFNSDFRNATAMLKGRMSKRFPDNFHARVGPNANSVRDFGAERAQAIDTASATIAAALRNGATAKQAADAGAASVGI